ncbi:MAG: MAPEG family protein [Pseudomonadota bacterium]
MAFELAAVVWTTLILFTLLMVQGTLVPLNQGLAWGLGSRDAARDKSAFQERTGRTIANHIEGMLLFIPLAMLVALLELSSTLTLWGAGLYLGGRVAFALFYLPGVPYLRSAAWGVAILGNILIAIPVFAAMM